MGTVDGDKNQRPETIYNREEREDGVGKMRIRIDENRATFDGTVELVNANETTVEAAVVGKAMLVRKIRIDNGQVADVLVTIRDGTAGTVKHIFKVPADDSISESDLRMLFTSGNAITAQSSAGGASPNAVSVYVDGILLTELNN